MDTVFEELAKEYPVVTFLRVRQAEQHLHQHPSPKVQQQELVSQVSVHVRLRLRSFQTFLKNLMYQPYPSSLY